MMKNANVLSLFRRRPPAWEAAPDRATVTEPVLALADQLGGASNWPTQAAHAVAGTRVLTRIDRAADKDHRDLSPGANGQRLRFARELLRSFNQPSTEPSEARQRDEPGESDVQP